MTLYLVQVGGNDDCYIILQAPTPEQAVEQARALPGGDRFEESELRAEFTERGRWTVGKRYRGPAFTGSSSPTYVCVAYDWRTGWWMKNEDTGEMRDISERALGRTFHETREFV